MNRILLLSSLLTFLPAAFAQGFDPSIINEVVYGSDNRMEVYEAPGPYAELATPALNFQDRYRLCEGERFATQKIATRCTGFLVAPDVLVTAGHCVQNESQCTGSSWIFDFNAERGDVVKTTFPLSNVYKCKAIIAREKNLETQNDFAVIRLDRKVKGRTPLKVRLTGKVENNTELLIIGHPASLPTKIVDRGTMRVNDNAVFFSANIDSFAGNSGSPVMDAKTGLVEGILVRGEKDFIYDNDKSCYTTNVCAEGTCRGEDATRITNIAEILKPLLK